jgi:hypothetical protein
MTADPRTRHLVRRRARAQAGLLVALSATAAVGVAAVIVLVSALAVAGEGPPRPAGMSDDAYAAAVAEGSAALARTAPGLVLAVAVVAVMAVLQLARLLSVARSAESAFARARGLAPRQAVALAAAEAGAVALVGAIAGAGAAAALLPAVLPAFGASGPRVISPAALVVAAALVVVLALAVLVVGARRPRRAGRVARAASGVLVGIIVLGAGFAAWRVVAAPDPDDPIAAVAVPLLLLTVALAVLALSAPALRLAAAVAARRRGAGAWLATTGAARRLVVHGVAIVLLAFAAGQVGFGAVAAATADKAAAATAAERTGADLRVDLAPDAVTPAQAAGAAAAAGVRAVAPAITEALQSGSEAFELVALPAARVADVVAAVPGRVDPSALAGAVDGGVRLLELPPEARELRLVVDARTDAPRDLDLVELSAFIEDADGVIMRLRFATIATTTADTSGAALIGDATLPEGTGAWRVAGIVAQLRASAGPPTVELTLRSLEADGRLAATDPTGQGTLDARTASTAIWAPAAADAVPAVVGAALADRLGLRAGDTVDARFAGAGRSLSLRVVGVVPAVPGASGAAAVFADAGAVGAATLRGDGSIPPATSLWAAGSPDAAAALSAALGDREVRLALPGPADAVARTAGPAWSVAVTGSIALALVAFVASTRTLLLSRAAEVTALRALGAAPRVQARLRSAELLIVAGFAVAAGAGAGTLAGVLVAPALAGAGDAALAVVGVDVALLAAGLAALVTGGVIVACAAGAATARAARSASSAGAGS